jgi:hypothetical protein
VKLRRSSAGIATVLFLLCTPIRHTIGADDARSLETAIKATYLAKFASFVTWPDQAFSASAGTFNLCVVGGTPFGALLDRAVAGQSVEGRPIAVFRIPTVSQTDNCQIVYLAANDPHSARQSLIAIAGLPILTITDAAAADAYKGMINFVVVDNRVRFEIDDAAAMRSSLVVSSKLLSVALSVKTKP